MNRQLIWGFLAIGFAVWGIGYTGYHVGRWPGPRAALVTVVVVLALAFDFTNGIHDAANSIATVVSTRVLDAVAGRRLGRVLQLRRRLRVWHPRRHDDRQGRRRPEIVDTPMILSGLLGAILEPHHVVPGAPDKFLARPDRRAWRAPLSPRRASERSS